MKKDQSTAEHVTVATKANAHLLRKSMDWFLYDIDLRHERVKLIMRNQPHYQDKVYFGIVKT